MKDSAKRRNDAQLESFVYAGESGIHGTGLFAVCDFPEGSYIGTFHGRETQEDGEHVLWVYAEDGQSAVGRIGENLLRFLNHAVTCNAEFEAFDLYARCAIVAGEEITIDYEGAG